MNAITEKKENPFHIKNADKFYDVIIVGGGPAGLTAALYLGRAKYRVLVIEKEQFGGQITITDEVVNYPGIAITNGKELTNTIYRQAESFGAEFLLAEVTGLQLEQDVKIVSTSRGTYEALGILLASGAHPRKVGFQGEEEYKGRGVAYCATCDGEFFTGKEIFVIGGGYAAAEESVFLTKFAKKVTILIKGADFTCAETVAEQAKKQEKIKVLTNTVVEEVSGENGLNYIRYKNQETKEVTEYRAKEGESFGVFVFAGYEPATELVKGVAKLDEHNYIITDHAQKTSIDGLYAAGDICVKPLRQVVTATSDGALAATELEKYVSKMHKKTGLQAKKPIPKDRTRDREAKNMAAPSEHGKNMPSKEPSNGEKEAAEWFTSEMRMQLDTVFEKMEQPLILKLYLDERPVSNELKSYIEALSRLTDKLSVKMADDKTEFPPCVKLCYTDGAETGLAFHGVPGGHEFTSFVLGIYNAAGPGQTMDEEFNRRIKEFGKNVTIRLMVSLSCTMCPELVTAAQHIAAIAKNVTAEVYDIQHFEELKNKYKIMSVPCMVINEEKVYFGKKNIQQVLELIEKA